MFNSRHLSFKVAVAINFFIFIVCFCLGEKFCLGVSDDYFMARILEGIYGDDYNVHMVFVNVLYGYVLLPLYHLFPSVGWYYVGEIAAVFISFTTVSYVLIKKMGLQWGTILSALFVACFARDFYLTVQFTQCAAALGAAGMLLFVYSLDCKFVEKKMFLFALLLMMWGFCMRSDAFLMGIPFCALSLIFFAKKIINNKRKFILCAALVFLGLMGCKYLNDVHYTTPEYKKYSEFQPHRVMLGDKDNYDKDAVYDEIEENGMYGEDYSMLLNWIFYDSETFSVDSLKRITDKILKYTSPLKIPALPSKALYRFDISITHPCCWAYILICLILLYSGRKKSLYAWGSLAILLALMAYLVYLMRMVYRVETGLFFYATVLAIPLLKEMRSISNRRFTMLLVFFAIAYILCFYFTGSCQRSISSGSLIDVSRKKTVLSGYSAVWDYMDSLPGNTVFVVPMNTYWSFAGYRGPLYRSERIGSWKRIICIGFWTPYFPDVELSLKEYGIENPIRDVVKENVVFVGNNEILLDFLHRHYSENISVDTLRDINGVKFLKYSNGGLNGKR